MLGLIEFANSLKDSPARSQAIAEAVAAIAPLLTERPRLGLILGTGLGNLISEITSPQEITYSKIPHFPRSTAMAHRGSLFVGRICELPVLVMAGRCHLYEGYSREHVTLPTRVLHALGCETLLVTNAAGGINPQYQVGDVMAMDDHLDLMHSRGLFPVQTSRHWIQPRGTYDQELILQTLAIGRSADFPVQRGVYVGVKGPNYETRAEYRFFRRIGGDVVGMSTIPEVTVAAELGMRVLGISTVTNVARPDVKQTVTSDEVVHVAGLAEPRVRAIVKGIATNLSKAKSE